MPNSKPSIITVAESWPQIRTASLKPPKPPIEKTTSSLPLIAELLPNDISTSIIYKLFYLVFIIFIHFLSYSVLILITFFILTLFVSFFHIFVHSNWHHHFLHHSPQLVYRPRSQPLHHRCLLKTLQLQTQILALQVLLHKILHIIFQPSQIHTLSQIRLLLLTLVKQPLKHFQLATKKLRSPHFVQNLQVCNWGELDWSHKFINPVVELVVDLVEFQAQL